MPTGTLLAPAYVTLAWVAELLDVDERTVRRMLKRRPDMPCLRLGDSGNATIRFPRERLLKWLRAEEQGRPESHIHKDVAANPASRQEAESA